MTLFPSNHVRIILAIAGIAVLSLVLIAFVAVPLVKNLQETNQAIVRNESEIAKIEREISSYEALSAKFSKADRERQAIGQMFPIREEMVRLVEGMESALARSGLFSTLSIYDKENEQGSGRAGAKGSPTSLVSGLKNVEEVPYVLELAGSDYRQFVNFLLYLENLPFFTEASKLSLVADSLQQEGEKILRNTGTATGKLEAVFFIAHP